MTTRVPQAEPAPVPEFAPRRFSGPVWAWGLWDWGSAAFNAVITTFVFSTYITSDELFGGDAAMWHAIAMAIAGVCVALIAPMTGQRADEGGRTRWLGIHTLVVAACAGGMFFVAPDQGYLWFGLVLLGVGTLFFELASVNYNAILNQLTDAANVGRVSALGWALGYFGGIVLLLVVNFGLIAPFGDEAHDYIGVRLTMLVCAAWTLVFAVPVLWTFRERDPRERTARSRVSIAESYRRVFHTVRDLWREDRNLVRFLIASAVFRDGLTGVFTFGAVLATVTFDFTTEGVMYFAVAANIVAGVATFAFGSVDDRLGPRFVIVLSLTLMCAAGIVIFFLHDGGQKVFWVAGLVLCVFVGPAQSASRTFLARLIPAGEEARVYGLYATTGKAASFLSPAFVALFIWVGALVIDAEQRNDAQYFGILGILVVLVAGLLLVLPVRNATSDRSALALAGTRGS